MQSYALCRAVRPREQVYGARVPCCGVACVPVCARVTGRARRWTVEGTQRICLSLSADRALLVVCPRFDCVVASKGKSLYPYR